MSSEHLDWEQHISCGFSSNLEGKLKERWHGMIYSYHSLAREGAGAAAALMQSPTLADTIGGVKCVVPDSPAGPD